ncbi:MAG TPA: DUF1700 domain-containing protein [Candidatus Pelethenecus sp.]|nr:DUF1700 domain-containing protein [Candidatus Pelethenecus sp.]
MRKKEFLKKLSIRLNHLDRQDRNDILDYYDELIEDSIDRTGKTEAEVIYDLGELEDIVRRVDPSYKAKIRYEEEEDYHPTKRNRPIPATNRRREARRKRSVIGIVLMICLIPVWFAVFMCLFAVIIAITGAGIGVFAGGIVSIWHGATLFTTNSTMALFQIGVGILGMGIILIVAPLLIKIVCFIGKIISKLLKCLTGTSKRRYAYEN